MRFKVHKDILPQRNHSEYWLKCIFKISQVSNSFKGNFCRACHLELAYCYNANNSLILLKEDHKKIYALFQYNELAQASRPWHFNKSVNLKKDTKPRTHLKPPSTKFKRYRAFSSLYFRGPTSKADCNWERNRISFF